MPRAWHDRHTANKIEDEEKKQLYLRIVADKKPYFMRYIYPTLMKQYNTYIRNTMKRSLREFGLTVEELYALPQEELTDEQMSFLHYYEILMPVGTHNCVMNRICRRFEQEFDGYLGRHNANTEFDYTIMKSGAEYTRTQYNAILKLYENYNKRLRDYAVFASYERIDDCDMFSWMLDMRSEFERECADICSSKDSLCDIILDICYQRSSSKSFAWKICGYEIIQNMLRKHDYTVSYPTADTNGDIIFGGERFSIKQKRLGEFYEYSA